LYSVKIERGNPDKKPINTKEHMRWLSERYRRRKKEKYNENNKD